MGILKDFTKAMNDIHDSIMETGCGYVSFNYSGAGFELNVNEEEMQLSFYDRNGDEATKNYPNIEKRINDVVRDADENWLVMMAEANLEANQRMFEI